MGGLFKALVEGESSYREFWEAETNCDHLAIAIHVRFTTNFKIYKQP